MDGLICYLNTDLDLSSDHDLTDLAAAFETSMYCLHVTQAPDGKWHAIFEAKGNNVEPEQDIAAMLAVIESLDGPLRSVWDGCSLREFNIGYDCGADPWAFNQGLSANVLGQMAAVGASLRFTLYPDRGESRAPASH